MAVETHNLTNVVLQAIETWGSVQNHELGYETQDNSTAKRYRYVKIPAVYTAFGPVISGTPLGPYIVDANATYTAHHVSAAAHLAQGQVVGVARGTCGTANYYGFMEVAEPGAVTTVNVTHEAVLAGDLLDFQTGWLGSIDPATIGTSFVAGSIVAIAVDSHRASYSQAGVLLDTTKSITPISVKWR